VDQNKVGSAQIGVIPCCTAATISLSKALHTSFVEPREAGGRVVLNNLSEQIRDCLRHAEECAQKAAAQTDPGLRDGWLRFERRWREMARSWEFAERLDTPTDNSTNPNIKPSL
jgi:hypothetical protein